jgi:hypothetical protein
MNTQRSSAKSVYAGRCVSDAPDRLLRCPPGLGIAHDLTNHHGSPRPAKPAGLMIYIDGRGLGRGKRRR